MTHYRIRSAVGCLLAGVLAINAVRAAESAKPTKAQIESQQETNSITESRLGVTFQPEESRLGVTFQPKDSVESVEPSLVGVRLNLRDLPDVSVPVLNIDSPKRLMVSVQGFADALGLSWQAPGANSSGQLKTPIGAAEIPTAALLKVGNDQFVPIELLAAKLASQISFDSGEFALLCEVPWRERSDLTVRKSIQLTPDVFAPNGSLSRTRTALSGSHINGRTNASIDQQFAGILGPGIWNTQFSRGLFDGPSDIRLESLWWLYERDQHRSLLGFDRVNLNPLLNGFQLSGVQYAYTNNPNQVYQTQRGYSGQLVASAGQSSSTLQGVGPAGGTAELRVSGVVLQRQIISLDGQYLFNNVPTGAGQGIEVEVALYEFARPGLPVRVEQFLSQASAYQLAKGSYFHYVGFGELGDPLQRDRGSISNRGDLQQGSGAFYQTRYGLSDRVTLEAATQSLNGVRQYLFGSAFNLGRLGSWASYFARGSNSASAYQIFGDGEYRDFRWRADVIDREARFQGSEDRAIRSQRAEVLYEPNQQLELGLVYGLVESDFEPRRSFLKPSLRYSPNDQLTFRAKPSFDGQYSYDVDWIINARSRLGAGRFGDQTQAEYQYKLSETHRMRLLAIETRLQTQALSEPSADSQRRAALILDSNWGGRGRTVTSAGVIGGGENTGYLAEVSHELLPGLDARLRVERDGLFGASSDLLVQFFLIADFAVSGTRLLPNYGASGILGNEGAIAGALVSDSADIGDLDLGQLPILIDGQVRGYTMPGGKFALDDLQPGVYRVEMDGEGLPIEVAVANPARNVQVRRGGVTDLTFNFEIMLGFAGKAVLPGVLELANLHVEVITAKGELAQTSTLNRFGYYRVENLKPGQYKVRLVDKNGAVLATRGLVTLVDAFLFGQDLQ